MKKNIIEQFIEELKNQAEKEYQEETLKEQRKGFAEMGKAIVAYLEEMQKAGIPAELAEKILLSALTSSKNQED